MLPNIQINFEHFSKSLEILFLGDTLCKAAETFLIEILHSDPSHSAIQEIPLQWFLTFSLPRPP